MLFFEKELNNRGRSVLQYYCHLNNIPFSFGGIGDPLPKGFVPVGSIPFVEFYMGSFKPNYLPHWCRKNISRTIFENPPVFEKCFIKPSDQYKRFNGFIGEVSDRCKNIECTSVVEFLSEWRMYIANGEEIMTWWYSGLESHCDVIPNGLRVDFDIPKGFCGTLDYGILKDGTIEVVECHHPYSIGYYGDLDSKGGENYFKFLTEGYKYLKKSLDKK